MTNIHNVLTKHPFKVINLVNDYVIPLMTTIKTLKSLDLIRLTYDENSGLNLITLNYLFSHSRVHLKYLI